MKVYNNSLMAVQHVFIYLFIFFILVVKCSWGLVKFCFYIGILWTSSLHSLNYNTRKVNSIHINGALFAITAYYKGSSMPDPSENILIIFILTLFKINSEKEFLALFFIFLNHIIKFFCEGKNKDERIINVEIIFPK